MRLSCNVWSSSQYPNIESTKDKKIPKMTKKLDFCDIFRITNLKTKRKRKRKRKLTDHQWPLKYYLQRTRAVTSKRYLSEQGMNAPKL